MYNRKRKIKQLAEHVAKVKALALEIEESEDLGETYSSRERWRFSMYFGNVIYSSVDEISMLCDDLKEIKEADDV